MKSLNIRKGLELNVPISDIFMVDAEPHGNKMAMDAHESGPERFIRENPRTLDSISQNDGLMYSTAKVKHTVREGLEAYTYNSYILYIDDDGKLITNKAVEIEFINLNVLTLDEFCKNLMDAQAFTGLYDSTTFKYSFKGVGNFTMSDYADVHRMAVNSRMHFLDFYVYHKKVLSSIGFFLAGLYESDAKSQAEYLTDTELSEILDEVKKRRKFISEMSKDSGASFYR